MSLPTQQPASPSPASDRAPAPRSRLKGCAIILIAILAIYVAIVIVVPPRVDAMMTRVYASPVKVSDRARTLQQQMLVADLHADALIWARNLLVRNERGQVDVPRLQDSNVAVQLFSVPTKVPRNVSSHGTRGDQLNLLTIAAVAQGLPPTTWFSLESRAEHAAKRLARFARNSNGALTVVRTRDELRALLDRRAHGSREVGGILAIEGLHCLEGDAANVDGLYDAGYRVMGLIHQFDNDLGGSSQGVSDAGLTPLGREVVRRLVTRGVIIDLAHASPKVIDDVLAMTSGPLVVSHTGVQGTCTKPRNLSDEHLRKIAARGGVIGIGFWSGATCGRDAQAVARSIRFAVGVAGIDHVALGSDFDGDKMPFDAAGLDQITDALLEQGFNENEIRKIMGENTIRLLVERLPQ